MKYIKFTYVDSITGISITRSPATNGPSFPNVTGLEFIWARESKYPTDLPEFFGTCPDESNTNVDGVLGVFVQADWDLMYADELLARTAKINNSLHITKLAFRNRFTQTEKVMLEISALDDATAPMQQRQLAATLRATLSDVNAATFIDLSRSETRAGVQMLETVGLLAVGRATEILDNPVLPEERPL